MHEHTQSRLREVLRVIRERTPVKAFPAGTAAMSDVRTGYLDDLPVRRLVITFRAGGCAWTRQSGGCVMCGHWAGTARGMSSRKMDYPAQFRTETARYDLSGIQVLSLYNSGSMLNPDELPYDALTAILREVRDLPSIRKVVLETRAEYVDPAYVRELAGILSPGKRLSLAMGLETADDTIRDLCLNKGCSGARLQEAIESVRGVADVQLYILAGIPFLTESEAIADAVSSIRWAHSQGAGEIHIEPLTVQRHTLIEALVRAGQYRLPSLHSLFEILGQVLPDIRPYVSPFMHMPRPERLPESCPFCTDRLREQLLGFYNVTRDRNALAHESCACAERWRERLRESDPRPLEQRVREALDKLDRGGFPC